MSRRFAAIAGALLLLSSATAAHAASGEPASQPIVVGRSHQLHSTVLGDMRELNVRLPAGYAEGARTYPVLYLLDGGLEQDFEHIAALAQLGEVSGTFGPFIVVGVQTKARRAELTPPAADARYRFAFPEAGGAERYRRFLSQEVIPFVTAHYRAGARRAVLGESLAGLFVVDTLRAQPQLFDDYIAISPSLWWDDQGVVGALERTLAPATLKGRRLFLALADEGGTMQSGADRLRQALAAQRSPDFQVLYADRSKTDTHATVLHGAALEALRGFYAAPPIDYGPTPWFMIEGANPPGFPAR